MKSKIKNMRKNLTPLIAFLFVIMGFQLRSQDVIFKTTGDSIRAKVTEVGTNAVSFKKADNPNGPIFVLAKSEIVFIRYASGKVEKFDKAVTTNTTSAQSMTNSATSNTTASNSNTQQSQQSSDGKVKIEKVNDKKYTINGQPATRKEVNAQLGRSKNPAVLVLLKTTKMTAGAQKITKLTSIPTTIGGGGALVVTLANGYQNLQRGRAHSSDLIGIGTSLLTTITLPITNKILKKKSGKMYDKIIDMYNLTN